jgi:hypothetical protein
LNFPTPRALIMVRPCCIIRLVVVASAARGAIDLD